MFNKRLFLVRHGETEMNKASIIQGSIDSPLTNLGLQQAQEVAQKAKSFKADIIISSNLGRAKHTAEIISAEIGVPLLRTDSVLQERNFGELEGVTFTEASKKYPKYITENGMFMLYNEFKNAEPVIDFYHRVVKGVTKIMNDHQDKNVILVAHGGVLRMMYAYMNKIDPREVWKAYEPKNCEVLNY